MTVTRTQLQIFLERAPSMPFDDDSEPRFRVVAALGQGAARRHLVPLTREHLTEEDAMRVFADTIRNGILTAADVTMRMGVLADMHVGQHEERHHKAPSTAGFAAPAAPTVGAASALDGGKRKRFGR